MSEHSFEIRALEASTAASAAFPWIREQLPVCHDDGTYPLTGTCLEEPMVSMLYRASLAGRSTNLCFLGPRGLMVMALDGSEDGDVEPALTIPADSPYTFGQYLQDIKDLGRPLPVQVAGGGLSSPSMPHALAVA